MELRRPVKNDILLAYWLVFKIRRVLIPATILDKTPWDSTAKFIFFLSFLGSLLKKCILLEIFLQFSLPLPYTKKSGKNSGYVRPTLFVGLEEGLDLCELENAPEMQKCSNTFVHDCLKKKGEENRQF